MARQDFWAGFVGVTVGVLAGMGGVLAFEAVRRNGQPHSSSGKMANG